MNAPKDLLNTFLSHTNLQWPGVSQCERTLRVAVGDVLRRAGLGASRCRHGDSEVQRAHLVQHGVRPPPYRTTPRLSRSHLIVRQIHCTTWRRTQRRTWCDQQQVETTQLRVLAVQSGLGTHAAGWAEFCCERTRPPGLVNSVCDTFCGIGHTKDHVDFCQNS